MIQHMRSGNAKRGRWQDGESRKPRILLTMSSVSILMITRTWIGGGLGHDSQAAQDCWTHWRRQFDVFRSVLCDAYDRECNGIGYSGSHAGHIWHARWRGHHTPRNLRYER